MAAARQSGIVEQVQVEDPVPDHATGEEHNNNGGRVSTVISEIRSTHSRRSRSSVASKRAQLEKEERLAQLRQQQRILEAARIADEMALIDLRSQVLSEEEDEEEDKRSTGSSTRQERVAKWAEEQYQRVAKDGSTLQNHGMQDQIGPSFPVSSPTYPNFGNSHIFPDHGTTSQADPFQKMAESTTKAMTTAMKQVNPTEEGSMKSFVARQSSGVRDLPEFNGNPEDFPTFAARFRRSTELCKFSDEENIFRLQKALKGKAKESVQCMLTSAKNLTSILDVLEKRFGRPEQILKVMVEKARSAPAPTEGDFQSLVDFSIVVKNLCATAESLNRPVYLHNPQLIEEFFKKLPTHLQLEWGRHAARTGMDVDLRKFSCFLDEISAAAIYVCDTSVIVNQPIKKQKSNILVVSDSKCPLGCSHSHSLSECQRFKKMKQWERFEAAKKHRACFSCLEIGHPKTRCPHPSSCDEVGCGMDHHRLLHRKRRDSVVTLNADSNDGMDHGETSDETSQSSTIGVVSSIVPAPLGKVLLKVAPVELVGPKGKLYVNAFLDEGSSLTIIEDDVAKSLGLDGECSSLYLNWLGGRRDEDHTSKLVSLKIRGINEKQVFQLSNVRTKKNLNLPVQPISNLKLLKRMKHLEDVPLPNVIHEKLVILIGSDHSHLLLGRKFAEGPVNTPMATYTYLGWVIHGRNSMSEVARSHVSMVAVEENDPDVALHELVKEQFRLEALGIINCTKLPQSKRDARAEMLMEATAKKDGDHWEVGLLWKYDSLKLPNSNIAAERRLKTVEKQMDKDPTFGEIYCKKIEEYEAKGFCRKLKKDEIEENNGRVWYLPHFGVTNPNKPGKFRLVFDCAAKANGMSLNDALLQGPDVMCQLIDVLLKFRQYEVAFSGDIRDMFHMVRIRQEDVPALRFLWRGKDRSQPPSVYTMDVMVFGAVSSPFQAQWIKNKNAQEFQEEFPVAVDAILNRHYVDDYLDSCSTKQQAIEKINEVREIHRRGGFEIRGWLCNENEVLRSVETEVNLSKVESTKVLLEIEECLERVLGMHWNPKENVFKFKTSYRNLDSKIISGEKLPTKRELLRLIMSLFDPLGFLANLTVRGKILLQDVWRASIGWDEQLSAGLEEKWRKFLDQLKKIPEVIVNRCFAPAISKCEDLQLHIMCDASQQAYCAVAYLRARIGREVSVNIVLAKSRVAPIKLLSIPRMELQAALIAARLTKVVKRNLDLKLNLTVLWTDSRNVLCWLKADDPGRFKQYVAYRIGEILELTDADMWRWVPTKQNVADDGTRDVDAADINPESRWFLGPAFLYEPEEYWPKESRCSVQLPKDEDLEVRRVCCVVTAISDVLPNVNRFSCWMKLIRSTAWIIRFLRNFCASHGHGVKNENLSLSVEEINYATGLWLQKVQTESFSGEMDDLRGERELSKSSKLSRLSPVLKNGLICVGSRIEKSPNIPMSVKFPVILDPSHPWTKLLLRWSHIKYGHHGVEKICNEIRQKYWILKLKSEVKKAARNCAECNLERAKQIAPQMAALPEVRVKKPERPFTYVGLDYFGPIDIINGRKREKRYGALFTCLSTRAVHLEVVHSLTTDDTIMAINRFVCRRGEPKELWSDNGTNFRGADNELKKALQELNQADITTKMAAQNIKWIFIPPGAPHMGGAWERLVRSVKTAMKTILKNRSITDQVLQTVMVEAEASVNSRPLTIVSSDYADCEAITPNCFLMGTTSVSQPPGSFDDGDFSLRKRWRHAQVLANHFWNRWLKEYLPCLSLRTTWNKKTPDIQVGELVFVADLNQQRNMWTKGLVQAVYPGKDGSVRIVDVKTAAGILRRPVAKLYRVDGWNQDGDSTI